MATSELEAGETTTWPSRRTVLARRTAGSDAAVPVDGPAATSTAAFAASLAAIPMVSRLANFEVAMAAPNPFLSRALGLLASTDKHCGCLAER